jgi:divalent metal cation (Fe/Co/Zn/Cd) transporter
MDRQRRHRPSRNQTISAELIDLMGVINRTAKTNVDHLKSQALILVWVGEIWNLLEAGVGLWSGIGAGSVALIGFGLDSLLELAAGAILIWRLQTEWQDKDEESTAERKAHKLVGITFFVLAGYIFLQSVATLLGYFPEPQETTAGLILIVASAVVMTVLYFKKMTIAEKISSRALRAEAKETLVCDLQDLTVLIGLGANFLFGWWWADPLAALALIPFLVKEGWEGVMGEDDGD